MGYKIKAGMALGGLVLSWAFGLNFLSGVATYLDSTGNVLVDVADGIGLVSKGIEALENYLDPPQKNTEESEPTLGGEKPPDEKPELPTPTPSPTISAKKHHAVICKKGRCQRYDPSKDRILQQQIIKAERERILEQVRSGDVAADSLLPRVINLDLDEDEDDDDDNRRIKKIKALKNQRNAKNNNQLERSNKKILLNEETSTTTTTTSTTNTLTQETDSSSDTNNTESLSGWKLGLKKVLNRSSQLFSKLNTFLLKLVSTVFPWNKRAKRRLLDDGGDGGDDE